MATQRGVEDVLQETVKSYTKTCYAPDLYADPNESLRSELRVFLKNVFDSTKTSESKYGLSKCSCPIKELLVSGFDLEQVWQQIQLQNDPALKVLTKHVKVLNSLSVAASKKADALERKRTRAEDAVNNDDNSDTAEIPENGNDLSEEEEESLLEEQNEELSEDMEDFSDEDSGDVVKPLRSAGRKSAVDDKFFSLADMEQFLDKEDRKEQRKLDGDVDSSDDEEIDLFGVMDSEDEDDPDENKTDPRDMKYKDYFDPPAEGETHAKKDAPSIAAKKKARTSPEAVPDEPQLYEKQPTEANEKESATSRLSRYEKEQELIQKKISRLEEANTAEKTWQLRGESSATQRPLNSLLEEHVTFDHTSVGAPTITEETTECLEDLIRQRIKDEAWDDVARKVKPNPDDDAKFKRPVVLDQTKSKLGLAEVYEKEYIKQTEKETEAEENKEHVAIDAMMRRLFVKLDALSNFHFAPKPPKRELEVVANVPSLQVEEVTPDTVTDAMRLAPEEVHATSNADEKGDTEKTTTDKKRERRVKKTTRHKQEVEKKRKRKLTETSNGDGSVTKRSKKSALEALKKSTKTTIVSSKENVDTSFKSSSAFFTKLQDDIKNKISKKKLEPKSKKQTRSTATVQAVKL